MRKPDINRVDKICARAEKIREFFPKINKYYSVELAARLTDVINSEHLDIMISELWTAPYSRDDKLVILCRYCWPPIANTTVGAPFVEALAREDIKFDPSVA